MTKQTIIERTIHAINQLPLNKAEEIVDFVDFIIKRYEEQLLTQGIQQLASEGQTFDFLNQEEDLYTVSDLKEVYNG
ncbi:hypothetical protein [Haliscomenobacter sp.]|jgi:hypothetical protein|uniref:hypothetical protein n=1 Tax=Haliscomenobacter sp. TaxID=2717303 RepID=UPI0033650225